MINFDGKPETKYDHLVLFHQRPFGVFLYKTYRWPLARIIELKIEIYLVKALIFKIEGYFFIINEIYACMTFRSSSLTFS